MKTLSTRPYRRPTTSFLLGNDIEHFFDQFFGPQNTMTESGNVASPNTNIFEHSDYFTLVAELPGVKKEDLKLSVEDGVLTIMANRSKQSETELGNSKRREIFSGHYQRRFSIDDLIDEATISANYDQGVLTLKLPKRQASTPVKTQIAVN
jgi:HSP20 family protein